LTNPNIRREPFNPAMLQGAGMPGVVSSDSSPDQANWDAFWPKGMNLSEWDLFFDNMDVDFSSGDSSMGTGFTNPSSSTEGLIFSESNPFGNTATNINQWDFGNASFGNGVIQ